MIELQMPIIFRQMYQSFSDRIYSKNEDNFNNCFKQKIQKLIKEKVNCSTALIQGLNFSSKMPFCKSGIREASVASMDTFIHGMQNLDDIGCQC